MSCSYRKGDLNMLQGILIILAFVIIAALMMTKKIPTLLALPLMAVVICLIAGVPAIGVNADGVAIGWLQAVLEAGTVRMGAAIMAVIFGSWLGQLMNKTGITENIIKKSAELGGDKPLVVTLILCVAVALLFTTLSGLGSIIMVGSIVLPILISIGVPALSAASIFLMSFTTGLTFNIANWKMFAGIFSLEIDQIRNFEIYLMTATAVATLILIFVEFKKNGIKFAFSAPAKQEAKTTQLTGVRGGLAMLTPLIPIVLVAGLKVPVCPAFMVGIAWALLFTTLSGLGSIIMVGSIVLPILISIGVPALSAASIFLMSFTTGLTFNIANWKMFAGIFSLEIDQIRNFEIYLMIATAVATLILIFVEFKKNGIKFAFSAPAKQEAKTTQLTGVRGGLAMFTPLIPIVLVAGLKVPVCPAFMVGIAWALIFTSTSFAKAMNTLTKTCYDGITDAGPAVILMVGIGILYLAVTHPMVKEVLNPFLLAVTPKSKIAYILFFSLLAPLALYRGPMNLFGLGSGIAALIIGLGTLSPLAVMGAFLSAERIQGCGDPTNTQNVWTANFCEVDVNSITRKLLPYLWVIAVFGVVLSAVLFFN